MVKTLEISAHLPGVTVKEYYDIFQDHDSFKEYLYEISDDKRVRISSWTSNHPGVQTRRASYSIPLDAPAWFKKTTGAHMLLLRDSQDVSVEEDERGGLRLVHSTSAPALVLPWKEEGVSIATISFTVTSELHSGIQGCRMVANMSCSARELSFLWGMQSAVEGIMAAQVSKSTQKFLDYSVRKCARFAVQQGRHIVVPAGILDDDEMDAGPHSPSASLLSQDSVYFDAEEDVAPALPHFRDQSVRRFWRKACFFLCCCGACTRKPRPSPQALPTVASQKV